MYVIMAFVGIRVFTVVFFLALFLKDFQGIVFLLGKEGLRV